MPKDDVKLTKPADQMPAPAAGIVELDQFAIAAVAGGLNPQPLPPMRALRFG